MAGPDPRKRQKAELAANNLLRQLGRSRTAVEDAKTHEKREISNLRSLDLKAVRKLMLKSLNDLRDYSTSISKVPTVRQVVREEEQRLVRMGADLAKTPPISERVQLMELQDEIAKAREDLIGHSRNVRHILGRVSAVHKQLAQDERYNHVMARTAKELGIERDEFGSVVRESGVYYANFVRHLNLVLSHLFAVENKLTKCHFKIDGLEIKALISEAINLIGEFDALMREQKRIVGKSRIVLAAIDHVLKDVHKFEKAVMQQTDDSQEAMMRISGAQNMEYPNLHILKRFLKV